MNKLSQVLKEAAALHGGSPQNLALLWLAVRPIVYITALLYCILLLYSKYVNSSVVLSSTLCSCFDMFSILKDFFK